ncbi:hypothetical protein [Mesorhizobium sp. M0088]|uniref:hypothetical protein n=1 Tax=Mesorhizobium sp. M0088 TaxID=2956873 RepID=UPI003334D3B4
MSETSVYSEVRKIIADKIAAGEIVIVDWLTHEIVAGKPGIEGTDTEFYRVCAYTHVKDLVKRCVGKYDARPETDRQLTLAGFEHLQVAYTVDREGRVTLVPVDQLSDSEIIGRAKAYDLMAEGCRAHARELRSYLRERRSAA